MSAPDLSKAPIRELMLLAAKAVGHEVPNEAVPHGWDGRHEPDGTFSWPNDCEGRSHRYWRPHLDDGDCFRLAVDLRLTIISHRNLKGEETGVSAGFFNQEDVALTYQPYEKDPRAATRRAVMLAAGYIGYYKDQQGKGE